MQKDENNCNHIAIQFVSMTSVEPEDKLSPELFNVIKTVDQQVISMEQNLRRPTISLDDNTKNAIKSNLEALHSSIVQMSDLCIKQVDGMSNELSNLDTQITEIDGILEFVNEAAGAVLFNQEFNKPQTQINSHPQQNDDEFSSPVKKNGCPYPGEDYCINMDALENIGRQITEPSSNDLIIPIPPDQIQFTKKPWSTQDDFFKKQDLKVSRLLFN